MEAREDGRRRNKSPVVVETPRHSTSHRRRRHLRRLVATGTGIASLCSATYVHGQRATARIRPPLLQQSIDISCRQGAQQRTAAAACGRRQDRQTDRETERRTASRQLHRQLHTMLAVPITHRQRYDTGAGICRDLFTARELN